MFGNVGSTYYLGLDLGQAQDYSAIVIVERRVELTGSRNPVTCEPVKRRRILARHLERIPLRTPYPEVVERVRWLVNHGRLAGSTQIVMDATGVGMAVKDLMLRARMGALVIAVSITSGEHPSYAHNTYMVPRHDLLANLRLLLEQQGLEIICRGRAAQTLREELLRWGRRSQHDDLVFALALGCWRAVDQPLLLNGAGPVAMLFPRVQE